ncbi:MAG: GtrA family protein [Proteobacteria bacterium]|nr:GtrA family protein [Pseudomonadota bacterium]
MSQPISLVNSLKAWQRFFIVGCANTLLTYFLYLLLKHFVNYDKAYFSAYFFGIIISYCLNGKMVFLTKLSAQTLIMYSFIYLAQYALSAIILKLLIQSKIVNDTLAPLMVTVIIVPLTFLTTRFIFTVDFFGKSLQNKEKSNAKPKI